MYLDVLVKICFLLAVVTSSGNCQSGIICSKYENIKNPINPLSEVIFRDEPNNGKNTEQCNDSKLNETINDAVEKRCVNVKEELLNLENQTKKLEMKLKEKTYCAHLEGQVATLNRSLMNLEKQLEDIQEDKFCQPNHCENNGECISGRNDYACKCQVGYSGRNCSTRIQCAVFTASEHSSSSTNLTKVFVGKSVTFSCDPGFRIVGKSLREERMTCRDDGTWTEDEAPECENCYAGVKSGNVEDSQIVASSAYDPYYKHQGRLDNPTGCWRSGYFGGWLQVDLSVPTYVTAVVTQGGGVFPHYRHNNWVTEFKIMYGNSTNDLKTIKEDNEYKIFNGNKDSDGHVINSFPQPITARYFRLVVVQGKNSWCLRLDYLTC